MLLFLSQSKEDLMFWKYIVLDENNNINIDLSLDGQINYILENANFNI